MAGTVIDISGRIKQCPKFVKIGEKSFKVDDSKNTVLEVMQIMENNSSSDAAMMDNILTKLLGQDAKKYTDTLSFDDFKVVFIAVMAAVQGTTYEECEATFLGKAAV